MFLFANLISACVSPLRKTSKLEAPVFVIAGLFQGLSLLLLNSALCNDNTLIAQLQEDAANLGNNGLEFSDSCSISTGANCTIAAVSKHICNNSKIIHISHYAIFAIYHTDGVLVGGGNYF